MKVLHLNLLVDRTQPTIPWGRHWWWIDFKSHPEATIHWACDKMEPIEDEDYFSGCRFCGCYERT